MGGSLTMYRHVSTAACSLCNRFATIFLHHSTSAGTHTCLLFPGRSGNAACSTRLRLQNVTDMQIAHPGRSGAASVHVLSYAACLPCLQSAGHVTHRNNAGALLAWCCAQHQQGSLRTGVISQMEDEDGHRLYPGRALAFTKSQLTAAQCNVCHIVLVLQVVHLKSSTGLLHDAKPSVSSVLNLRDGCFSTHHVVQLDCTATTHDVNQY
jgi:hypothetical protein